LCTGSSATRFRQYRTNDPHECGVRFFLHNGDMTDATNLICIVQDVRPTEIYNLAAERR
jgi:GDPmannose 4,6-dehydratase